MGRRRNVIPCNICGCPVKQHERVERTVTCKRCARRPRDERGRFATRWVVGGRTLRFIDPLIRESENDEKGEVPALPYLLGTWAAVVVTAVARLWLPLWPWLGLEVTVMGMGAWLVVTR